MQVLYEQARLLPLLFIGSTMQTHSPKKIQKIPNQVHRPAGQFLVRKKRIHLKLNIPRSMSREESSVFRGDKT